MVHQELLLAGHLVGGVCDQSVGKEQVYSPYDGRLVGTVAEAGPNEIEAAISAAHDSFRAWRDAPISDRGRLLRDLAGAIRGRRAELAALLVDEVGKPLRFALGEIDRTALTFDLAADELTRPAGVGLPATFDHRGEGVSIRTGRFPLGVVLCITPYNWPFNLAAHKVAAALATGNTVVVKVPSLAPLCGLALGKILHEAGCPDGVANVVHCSNALAEKMVADQRVAIVSFTGSGRVGRHIQSIVPHKKVALELGGDAYALVGPDADLKHAAESLATSAFAYAGQVCISTQHIRCHQDVSARFRELMAEATEQCRTGDPADALTVCGPLINAAAADRVMGQIEDAESRGATVIVGGHRVGNTVWPTLLQDVPPDCTVAKEEVFGPVATLGTFDDWEQGFAMVNSSQFGLQAAVFTHDLDVAQAAFQGLDVGGVIVNDSPSTRFDNMPYGGVKESGNTREGLAYAMAEMTTERVLVTRHRPVT